MGLSDRFTVPGDPSAPRLARHRVTELARRAGGIDCDLLALLVSEVTTNALFHGGREISICVETDVRCIRVEVWDSASWDGRHPAGNHGADGEKDDPAPAARGSVELVAASSTGGRGLFIVDQLTSRWGVVGRDGGTVVWFELDRQSEYSAASANRPLLRS